MTIGGWILFGFFVICYFGVAAFIIAFSECTKKVAAATLMVASVLTIATFAGIHWYYNNTAAGQRAFKSQESNFNNGIERTVEVYDATGNLIKSYEGKFDVDYDNDRIIFDDENGKRHIIYYPTGTVIIDETE